MDNYITFARELGYEGHELRDFLIKQLDLEMEKRVAQRNYEQDKREAAQKDKDREAAQRAKELKLEK